MQLFKMPTKFKILGILDALLVFSVAFEMNVISFFNGCKSYSRGQGGRYFFSLKISTAVTMRILIFL
jgi:hypothetical protein